MSATATAAATGDFTMQIVPAAGRLLLVVRDAAGQAIGTADVYAVPGVRASALRIIRAHQLRLALAQGGGQ